LLEAVGLQQGTVRTATEALGDYHPVTLTEQSSLGSMLLSKGDVAEAERQARTAVERLRQVKGSSDILTADAMFTLSQITQSLGRYAETETLLRDVLRIYRKHFGENTLRTLWHEPALATALRRQDKLVEAAAVSRRVLQDARKAFGPEAHQTLRAEYYLAGTLARAGTDLDEAERLARHSSQGIHNFGGDNDPLVILYTDVLAQVLRRKGQPEEAERLLRSLVKLTEGLSTEAVQYHCQYLHQHLAEALLDQGRRDEAEPLLLEALRCLEAQKAPDPFRRADIARDLVRLYEASGQLEKAAEWRTKLPTPPAAATEATSR
jgi:tetratricopeptide (TPR) repeat protein